MHRWGGFLSKGCCFGNLLITFTLRRVPRKSSSARVSKKPQVGMESHWPGSKLSAHSLEFSLIHFLASLGVHRFDLSRRKQLVQMTKTVLLWCGGENCKRQSVVFHQYHSDLALEGVMVKLIPTGPWGWDGKIISDIFCHVTSQGKAMKFHVRLGALSLLTSWSHPTFRCHTVEDQPLWHSPCFMPTERSSARLRKHKNSQHVSLYSFSVEEAGKSDISDLHFSRFSTRSVITVISDK